MVLEGFLQNLVARLATQGLFSSQALGLGHRQGGGQGQPESPALLCPTHGAQGWPPESEPLSPHLRRGLLLPPSTAAPPGPLSPLFLGVSLPARPGDEHHSPQVSLS